MVILKLFLLGLIKNYANENVINDNIYEEDRNQKVRENMSSFNCKMVSIFS